VEAESNTSTVALRVVGDKEKRTQCLGVLKGHPVPGAYKYGHLSTPTLGPSQSPIQWISGALSPGVKRPGREADRSSPTSVEVKNV
jgi:hypothetical protein